MSKIENEVKEELDRLAPRLASISKVVPIDVPDQYFEKVEEKILSQMFLANRFPQEERKDIPNHYFDELERSVTERFAPEPKVLQMNTSHRMLTWRNLAAACGIIVVGFLFFFNQKNNDQAKDVSLDAISHDEYIEYIKDNVEEFDINLLIDNELIDSTIVEKLSYLDDYNDQSEPEDLIESEINF